MEKTPHVMLVGDGALQFAISQGFKKENLLVEASEKEWKEWLKTSVNIYPKPISKTTILSE
jgi:N4-(beta-N-acetylglucosaminyl)-L-asparaginase